MNLSTTASSSSNYLFRSLRTSSTDDSGREDDERRSNVDDESSNKQRASCCHLVKKVMPTRNGWFGVKMVGRDGRAAKITNEEKFTAWSWWILITPSFLSTVFRQPNLHVSVLIFTVLGNLIYYSVRNNVVLIDVRIFKGDEIKIIERLMTWLLSAYVLRIVSTYHVDAKKKGGRVIKGLSGIVSTLTVSVKYDAPTTNEFLFDIHSCLISSVHYAFAHATSNTSSALSKDGMEEIFNSRGLDGQYLCSFQKKDTVNILYRGMLQTLQHEIELDDQGCLSIVRYDDRRYERLLTSLEEFFGSIMQVMSSTSSNKYPFSYHQLIHWGVRISFFFDTVLSFGTKGFEDKAIDLPQPFHCWDSALSSTDYRIEKGCPTQAYIWYNAARILTAYFLMGCLELYPVLSKSWETSLVPDNYLKAADSVCVPLQPTSTDNVNGGKPKQLKELRRKETTKNV